MSTTQHPLTDETRDRLVSYISGGTIDCSTHEGRYDALSEDDARTLVESLWEPMMQAAQELPATPTEVTDEMVEAAAMALHVALHGSGCLNAPSNYVRAVRAALSAALAVAAPAEPSARTILAVPEGYGAPHHDADRIKAEDYVAQVDDSDFIRAGIAHHQDEAGDWMTEDGVCITWARVRAARPDALTVWPAPTPPAEEVHWEPQFGDIITDVRIDGAIEDYVAPRLVYVAGSWFDDTEDGWTMENIAAATLPDGTRVRRDGDRPDGTPRFVKVQEEEK